MKTPASRR